MSILYPVLFTIFFYDYFAFDFNYIAFVFMALE